MMEYGADYRLDLAGTESAEELHRRAAAAFGFPDWYGMNLDGLYDLLTQMQGRIIVEGAAEAAPAMEEYLQAFRMVVEDAAQDTPGLQAEFQERETEADDVSAAGWSYYEETGDEPELF